MFLSLTTTFALISDVDSSQKDVVTVPAATTTDATKAAPQILPNYKKK